jgi:hypothetical protein
MTRSAAICWVLLSVWALTAQQPPIPMPVRHIKVRLISTTSKGLTAIDFGAIAATWKSKGIDLAVERRLDPAAVEKAADAIRDMYADGGQKVRVEHTVTQIPPRSLEVAFEVIQLCACN